MNLIGQAIDLWNDPRLLYAIAIAAVVLLAITIWLFRRSKRDGRAAGSICLILSILLHAALIWLVPYQAEHHGGSTDQQPQPDNDGGRPLEFSTFDPDLEIADAAAQGESPTVEPLPVAELTDLLKETEPDSEPESIVSDASPNAIPEPDPIVELPTPASLDSSNIAESDPALEQMAQVLDSSFDQLLQSQLVIDQSSAASESAHQDFADQNSQPGDRVTADTNGTQQAVASMPSATADATAAVVPGSEQADFANRVGAAKLVAIAQTGGDAQTEAAVQAALRFLALHQRPDGAWDPRASGAGEERRPLGESRPGAGTQCATALTGLSLLAMMGSGNTHLQGDYSENVYRGLVYLIENQKPDGSLSGNATIYAATYCHSMAALSMCEAAVMTKDPSAIESSRRAVAHTLRMQHPATGGWRYTRGDPGDLSQLGWQAMVLDGGKRAGINIGRENVAGIERFLNSVRAGQGGLACYRPGEAISRTMTAEALATRLLIGEVVPQSHIDEAERYLMQELPGSRADNYYYWYYATLALHQLQDDAWTRWNSALKDRLLATQRPDGSWPNSTVWGGYGGTIYTTAMATLCLETYYRHAIRDADQRIAERP